MAETRFVVGGPDGWLRVRKDLGGEVVSIAEYTKVQLTAQRSGRDHFTPIEGVLAGIPCSVVAGNLSKNAPEYGGPARLTFNLTRQRLNYPGGFVRAITDPRNPIPVGTHPIQMPDFPHGLGAGYSGQTPYAKTWFYLGNGVAVAGRSDRYLHPGSVSAGCITVDASGWTALYRYLILCRSGNGKTVGSVTVVR